MNRILFIAFTLSIFISCSKSSSDKDKKPCEIDNTARLLVSNTSSNPYSIKLDGIVIGTASPGTITEFNEKAGGWNLKATQLSGFLFFPTEVSAIYSTDACDELSWQIP